jgi:hypothetical protein
MSEDNKDFIRKNWLTFSNVVVLVSFIIYQARWQQRVDSEILELKTSVIKHHSDKDAHMPFKDKIELFVPRTELERRLESIEKIVEKIDKKL